MESYTEERHEEAACNHCGRYRMCLVVYRIYDDEEVIESGPLCNECQER